MVTKKETAAPRDVSRSVTIQSADVTISDITSGATDVGAPDTARVSTANTNYSGTPDADYPYSITYTWTDTIA